MTQIIKAGIGYSFDMQQLAEQPCYDAVASPVSYAEGVFKVGSALSLYDFQSDLYKNTQLKGKFNKASVSRESSYTRFTQDKDCQFSLNYYLLAEGSVDIKLKGGGMNALTQFGKDIYTDVHKTFGLTCGDPITSYQVGALLVVRIIVDFKSHFDKKTLALSTT
jgi:hypothetical protein